MSSSEEIELNGTVFLDYIEKETGEVREGGCLHNLVVNNGKRDLAHRMCDTSTAYDGYYISRICIGYSNAAPGVTNTLASMSGSNGYSMTSSTTNANGTTYVRATATFDGATEISAYDPVEGWVVLGAAGALYWYGLGLVIGTNTLFSRVTSTNFGTTNWGSTYDLRVIWSVSYS